MYSVVFATQKTVITTTCCSWVKQACFCRLTSAIRELRFNQMNVSVIMFTAILVFLRGASGSEILKKFSTSSYSFSIFAPKISYVRGHQHGARGHQVARTNHVGGPRACSDNSTNMISVFTSTSLIFINDNIIEDKLSKFLFQKCVYQTGSPSLKSVPRCSSQFQKGWWPLSQVIIYSLKLCHKILRSAIATNNTIIYGYNLIRTVIALNGAYKPGSAWRERSENILMVGFGQSSL